MFKFKLSSLVHATKSKGSAPSLQRHKSVFVPAARVNGGNTPGWTYGSGEAFSFTSAPAAISIRAISALSSFDFWPFQFGLRSNASRLVCALGAALSVVLD
jgi:hypothetical protein